jgi:hypothetical protein
MRNVDFGINEGGGRRQKKSRVEKHERARQTREGKSFSIDSSGRAEWNTFKKFLKKPPSALVAEASAKTRRFE